jgi:hypothetical protein
VTPVAKKKAPSKAKARATVKGEIKVKRSARIRHR